MHQYLYHFLQYYLGVNMAHEISSFLGPNTIRIKEESFTIEDYEYEMDRLMSKKKERKYTM
jgi:hypothetical protein